LKKLPIAEIIALTFFLFVPVFLKDNYFLHLFILFLIWVVIGSSWNIFAGYTGQVSFGHAAFFGVGAYSAGLLAHHFGYSAWWGMALGGPMAVLIGLPFGVICFPLRGAYFTLASLALNLILMHLATIAERFTGGMQGVMIMPTFISKIPYYYIALAMAVATLIVVNIIVRSKFGYYFMSIREDQDAAESLGINSTLYKNISLGISVFFTGTAGALYMNYMGFIDPSVVFSLSDYSIMAILVAIVGGVGTVYGPTVGAFIMVAVNEFFRSGFFGLLGFIGKQTSSPSVSKALEVVTHAHVLVFGILVVVVILYLPKGVVGDWEKIRRKVFRIKPTE